MNTTSRESSSKTDDRIDKLTDQILTLVETVTKKVITPATVKAVEESCVICGDAHAYYNCNATDSNQSSVCVATGSTAHIQPPVIAIPIPEPDVPKTLPKPNIPYPSRLNDQNIREKATNQMVKFFQIFQELYFDISFADALLLMPKFASTIKSLLINKDKLFELAKIPLNENCLAMLLKKLPEKLGDPSKFLIPCEFPGMDVCHALADLGASINLRPLSIWKKLSLPELTPNRMNLELADRSITCPKGVAEDVFVKVGKFHFPTDFVVVDFDVDPRVPFILGRSFLRTGRALIDIYGEEITLRVNDEAVTFNLNQTTRYSYTYNDMSVNRIDIIDVACKEYAQEVFGFSNNSTGGNPTPTSKPIISDSSLSLTPFEGSDFILEEVEAYLKDNSISPEIDHADLDLEGDIRLIKELLNNDPSSPLPLFHNPLDSLIIENKELSTVSEKELDEFIKSSVEDLVPIPSEFEDTSRSHSECILPSCDNFSPSNVSEEKSVNFSNPLVDSINDFTSSDDESLSDEDVLEDIENKDSYVSNLDEMDLLVTPLSDTNEDECFDPGGDIDKIDAFLDINISTDIDDG
ncbi:reverse transcriptase domain-containing protein [Tanacetum coccineum]